MSKFDVRKYEEDHLNKWEKFVADSINGTIFHERNFISYHPADRFNDLSLLIFKNDNLFSVFPAAVIEKNSKKVLKSHPGTSYGGPVFLESPNLKDVFEVIKSIEKFALENDIDIIEFRQAPKIFLDQPMDQLDFALIHNDYKREDQELATCYPLKQYKGLDIDEMQMMFDKSGRNKVRKNVRKGIRKGLEFKEIPDSEIDLFYDILLDNLKKHSAKPAHSFEEIVKLKELYPERVSLYGVYSDNELAAGYLIFNINGRGNHVFYGSLNYKFQKLRPTSFGLFMLLKTFAEEGFDYLNMGISTEEGGRKINWSLLDFKESFNGTGILRTYWKKELK